MLYINFAQCSYGARFLGNRSLGYIRLKASCFRQSFVIFVVNLENGETRELAQNEALDLKCVHRKLLHLIRYLKNVHLVSQDEFVDDIY